MKAIPVAGGDQRRDRLVGGVGIAAGIGSPVHQHLGRGAHRLVVKQPIEQRAAPGDGGLDHDRAAAGTQHARRLAKEHGRKLEMMQHIDHDDVGGHLIRER